MRFLISLKSTSFRLKIKKKQDLTVCRIMMHENYSADSATYITESNCE